MLKHCFVTSFLISELFIFFGANIKWLRNEGVHLNVQLLRVNYLLRGAIVKTLVNLKARKVFARDVGLKLNIN